MNSAIEPRAASPKLPLWDTIVLSYGAYFSYFRDVFRIAWLWLLVVAVLTGIANWIQWSWFAEVLAQAKPAMSPAMRVQLSTPIKIAVLQHSASLVVLFAFVSVAVAWHRRIILDEPPKFSGSNLATRDLWRYVWVGFVICLIVVLPALVITLLILFVFSRFASGGGPPPASALLLIPPAILIYLTLMFVMMRLMLLLPARAVGDLSLTLAETWRGTRRNTWRMFWGLAACTLPPMLIAQFAFLFSVGVPGPGMLADEAFIARMAVITTLLTIYVLLIVPIAAGFLSLSYQHFFQRTSRFD